METPDMFPTCPPLKSLLIIAVRGHLARSSLRITEIAIDCPHLVSGHLAMLHAFLFGFAS